MARQLIPLAALLAALSMPARADESAPEADERRLYALASAGKLWLLGPGDYTGIGGNTRIEVGALLGAGLRAGLLLDASHHDVPHYETQSASMGGVELPGDIALGLLGPVVAWHPLDEAFQPGLRGQGGVVGWRSPMEPEAWREEQGHISGPEVPTRGLGGWAALGGDLGIEVMDEGPVLQLSLDGGYVMAGPLTGPMVAGRVAFRAAF